MLKKRNTNKTKNVKRCRDGTTKSMRTRKGWCMKAKVINCSDSILLQPCNGWKYDDQQEKWIQVWNFVLVVWHCSDLNTLHKIWLTTEMSIKQKDVTKQVNEVEDFPELVINCHLIAAQMHFFSMATTSNIAKFSHLTFLRLNSITIKRRFLKIRKNYWRVCSTTWV